MIITLHLHPLHTTGHPAKFALTQEKLHAMHLWGKIESIQTFLAFAEFIDPI